MRKDTYLSLAKYFLDQRGRDVKLTQYPPGSRFAIYNDAEQIQASRPVLEQDEAVGHAVRAAYMYTGMADVAALTGDSRYFEAIQRLWENVVNRKMALTGGIGARSDRERFGANYELPNATAYNETCAAIGNALWNHRMFLLTGDARYIDVMERVIYNGVISGVSLDGNAFFYPNPLESDGKSRFNKGVAGRAPSQRKCSGKCRSSCREEGTTIPGDSLLRLGTPGRGRNGRLDPKEIASFAAFAVQRGNFIFFRHNQLLLRKSTPFFI